MIAIPDDQMVKVVAILVLVIQELLVKAVILMMIPVPPQHPYETFVKALLKIL